MRSLSYLLFALIFPIAVIAQTPVSGGIYQNTTWNLSGSPYLVTGSIVVFPGNTLTIEPGCIVRFKADSSFNTGNFIYLEIRGALNAVGTPESPIAFTSTDTSDGFYNWMGIRIKGSQGGSVVMNNFELHNSWYGLHNDISEPGVAYSFSNCLFKKNNYAIQLNADMNYSNCRFEKNGVGQAAQIVYGTLNASNCEFIQNFCSFTWSNSIFVNDCVFDGNQNNIIGSPGTIQNSSFLNNTFAFTESANLQITNCTFVGNEVGIDENGGSNINNCSFYNNGIAVKLGESSVLTNNVISLNGSGVQVRAYNPTTTEINDNQICYNTLFNLENLTDKNFQVNTNCFCSTDSTEIENSILDGYDDITRGLINYSIYDSSCINVERVVAKVILEEPTSISNESANTDDFDISLNGKTVQIVVNTASFVRIHNLMGQLLYSDALNAGSNQITLGLNQGIYIVSDSKGNWKKFYLT